MTDAPKSGGDAPASPPPAPSDPPESHAGNDGGAPKTYDEAYVKQLRDEAADRRTKAKEADERARTLATKLLESTVAGTCKDLADADDLLVHCAPEDLLDEEGLPDYGKILLAEADLIKRKPHLKSRAPLGDIDQGVRGVPVDNFSFNDWLKNAAG